MKTTEEIAREIATDLFTDGAGKPALRLVMDYVGNAGGTGWSLEPAVDRIAKSLRESSKPVPEGKKYRDGLASACEGLQKYVEYFGPIHEDGCSQDDTCHCVFKPTNEDVSCLCVLAANAKGQRDFEARESALSSQGKAQ